MSIGNWRGLISTASERVTEHHHQDPETVHASGSLGDMYPARKSFLPSRKKARQRKINASKEEDVDDKLLWVDKYQPTSIKELCIAPKKVKEVQSWILQYPQVSKLMVLVGSPGTGKSTLIQVLCEYELHYNILQWSDSYRQGGQSPLTSFEDFLSQAGVFGGTPLSFEEVAGEGDTDELSTRGAGSIPNFPSKRKGRRRHGTKAKSWRGHDSNSYSADVKKGSLVLIDEIPNLHTINARAQFRQILTRHIQNSNVPTVLIFSDVSEGKHKPVDLERLIDPAILYSPTVEVMQIHPVTKIKMKSCLSKIIEMEGGRKVSNDIYDEYHALSGGDLRHAIMSLQFQIGANTMSRTLQSDPEERKLQYERDTRLSTFHALGRILYAKRQPMNNDTLLVQASASTVRVRPPLQFVPEKVMEQSDMELGGALYFLEHNSPEFFTDISELSTALDHFSDAALFLEKEHDGYIDLHYPLGYAASLGGRAVANANNNPTPNKFRQLNPPAIFDAIRKRRETDVSLSLFRNRLSRNGHLLINNNIGSSESFAVCDFPIVNQILPNEVSHAFSNIASNTQNTEVHDSSKYNEKIMSDWKSQVEILAEDDIIDDSSSDSDCLHPNIHGNHLMTSSELNPSKKSISQNICSPSSSGPEIIIID